MVWFVHDFQCVNLLSCFQKKKQIKAKQQNAKIETKKKSKVRAQVKKSLGHKAHGKIVFNIAEF